MNKKFKKIISILLMVLIIFTCFANINSVNATQISSSKNFYYKQLNNISKIIYEGMEENIENLKKDNFSIDYNTEFNDLLNQQDGQSKLAIDFQSAIDAFSYDHPELFYIDFSKISLVLGYVTTWQSTTYTVKMVPCETNCLSEEFSSENEVNNAIVKVENARDEIINSISGQSVYNKILKVHDILAQLLEYDITFEKSNIRNIYGAFIENQVVCEGYAKAFKYILDSLNIECILVGGDATNPSNVTEAHMWNYVKIKGNWYGVDVTWDDPVYIYGNNAITVGPTNEYLLKGKNVFGKSHKPTGIISYYGMTYSIPELCSSNYREDGLPFVDVQEGIWYYNAVKFTYEQGMIKGTTDTTFAPNKDLTRGMLVTILYRMEESPNVTKSDNFTDVPNDLWYSKAVNWAANNKIVNGYGNGKFGPEDKITREQLAVMLRSYANYKKKDTSARTDLTKFTDNKYISSYAKDSVSWAVANKIISGKSEGTRIDPHGKATRAEVATMLYSYCVNIK